jgi:hypothetical protein
MLKRFKKLKSKFENKKLRKDSKVLFWTWIAYQTIKGTITTTFIWIPTLLAWLHLKR